MTNLTRMIAITLLTIGCGCGPEPESPVIVVDTETPDAAADENSAMDGSVSADAGVPDDGGVPDDEDVAVAGEVCLGDELECSCAGEPDCQCCEEIQVYGDFADFVAADVADTADGLLLFGKQRADSTTAMVEARLEDGQWVTDVIADGGRHHSDNADRVQLRVGLDGVPQVLVDFDSEDLYGAIHGVRDGDGWQLSEAPSQQHRVTDFAASSVGRTAVTSRPSGNNVFEVHQQREPGEWSVSTGVGNFQLAPALAMGSEETHVAWHYGDRINYWRSVDGELDEDDVAALGSPIAAADVNLFVAPSDDVYLSFTETAAADAYITTVGRVVPTATGFELERVVARRDADVSNRFGAPPFAVDDEGRVFIAYETYERELAIEVTDASGERLLRRTIGGSLEFWDLRLAVSDDVVYVVAINRRGSTMVFGLPYAQ